MKWSVCLLLLSSQSEDWYPLLPFSCALIPLHLQYSQHVFQIFQIFQTWSSSGGLSFHKAFQYRVDCSLFWFDWASFWFSTPFASSICYLTCQIHKFLYVLQLFAIWDIFLFVLFYVPVQFSDRIVHFSQTCCQLLSSLVQNCDVV